VSVICWRFDSENISSFITSTASKKKNEPTSTATEAATPNSVTAARPGQRVIERRIIIVVWRSLRPRPMRSTRPCVNFGGAGGDMATAGRSRTVPRTARKGAGQHGRHGQHARNREGGRRWRADQIGKVEILAVELGHPVGHPDARAPADRQPTRPMRPPASDSGRRSPGRIADRLHQPDLLALQRDQPAQHHVDQEGRDDEEDRRHDPGQRLQLLQFVLEEIVRHLPIAVVPRRCRHTGRADSSMAAMTGAASAPGVSISVRSLKAPSRSKAEAAPRWLIQKMPKRRSSGNSVAGPIV
jgi:hypothetical protein